MIVWVIKVFFSRVANTAELMELTVNCIQNLFTVIVWLQPILYFVKLTLDMLTFSKIITKRIDIKKNYKLYFIPDSSQN